MTRITAPPASSRPAPYPDGRALRRLALLGIAASSSLALAACQQQAAPPPDGSDGRGDTLDTIAPDTGTPAASVGGAASADNGAGAGAVPEGQGAGDTPPPATPPAPKGETALDPPAPGEVGGLPDDRTPVAEGKIDPKSPQGAAQRLQNSAALLEEGKYGDAFALWGDSGKSSGMSKQAFIHSFAKYSEVHALVGGPQNPEGAAGSIYVTVPMQLYGRLKSGGTFNMVGPVTMRRVNDVPGATPAQLRWHITDSKLKPAGKVKEVPLK